MPKGGPRAGAGRPKGTTKAVIAARESAREIAEAANRIVPLDFFLKILNDPTATKAQRLRAAENAAPFMHPKVSASASAAVSNAPRSASSESTVSHDDNNLKIFAVPRGSHINPKTGEIIFPEDTVLKTVRPFKGTPDPLDDEEIASTQTNERLEVFELDTSNVHRLHRLDDDDDDDDAA